MVKAGPVVALVACEFAGDCPFPVKILLPMKLVTYNGGSRTLIIQSRQTALPRSIAEWIAGSLLNKSYKIVISEVDSGAVVEIEKGELYHL